MSCRPYIGQDKVQHREIITYIGLTCYCSLCFPAQWPALAVFVLFFSARPWDERSVSIKWIWISGLTRTKSWNPKRRALKFCEDLSNFQPVNSDLRPFREFLDRPFFGQYQNNPRLSWSLILNMPKIVGYIIYPKFRLQLKRGLFWYGHHPKITKWSQIGVHGLKIGQIFATNKCAFFGSKKKKKLNGY